MVSPLKVTLSLATADTIIAAALAEARAHGLLPLAVAVLDAGGHLVAYRREDGCGILRGDIAVAKAWGALGMGLNAATIGQRLAANPGFLNGLIAASGGRMAPNAGGLLIVDAAGQGIGAVGISGDTGDNDELCARAGLTAAGLSAATL